MTDFNVFVKNILSDRTLRSAFQADPIGTAQSSGLELDEEGEKVIFQLKGAVDATPDSFQKDFDQDEIDAALEKNLDCGFIKSSCDCKFKIFESAK